MNTLYTLRFRIILLCTISLICLCAIGILLLGMQTLPLPDGGPQKAEHTVLRTQTLPAVRGEIFDRNGLPLVTNQAVYALCFDYFSWPSKNCGPVIRDVLALLEAHDIPYSDSLPISAGEPYQYSYAPDSSAGQRMQRFLKYNGLDSNLSAEAAMEKLVKAYKLEDGFTGREQRQIIGVLYALYLNDFTYDNPYIVASDIDMELVSILTEQAQNYPGVTVDIQYKRQYSTAYAAHILGRTGKIPAESAAAYADLGYPMDAIVGRDGAEYAFESHLRGTDGQRIVETSASGDILRTISETPAQSGSDVYLTIDLPLQETAEQALAQQILALREAGTDAGGGAAVVLDVRQGQILAMASYPTFQLEYFSQDYTVLSQDSLSPLFNRAIAGTYAPGSTFKMVTAAAALGEGIIDADTSIECEGAYTYYAPNYYYHCWVYREYGINHGWLNAAHALQESCNCFFYEAGRLTGIRTISDYAAQFGLGSYTGIELSGEAKGQVAGPDSRGGDWYAGDTLHAAIGQSEHQYTPLQLANYIATIVNGGHHFGVSILNRTASADGTLSYPQKELRNELGFSEETYNTLITGMLAVTAQGTASSVFADFPISILGKSGSAQVSVGVANGIFVLAAPAEDPEIAVAVVIEHGASGNNAAIVAKEILSAYFCDIIEALETAQENPE